MKEILIAISFLSLELGEPNQDLNKSQIQNQWLGFEPAKVEEIQKTENRLKIKLPEDYKNFITITNGFSASNSIEPTFMKVEEIDYLKNIETETIEAYKIPELQNSILVAGMDEEQYFLLIPPQNQNDKWRYWKFANWYPGEHEFENLETYFRDILIFMEEEYN
ncbi:MAG: SMI1/KNR4 family protein [Kaistella sp.]|nr:SMI1/KNR4 family protein [Kaistella sp.]